MNKLITLLFLMLSFNAAADGMTVTWHSSPILAAANRASSTQIRQVIYDVNRVVHKYENDGYRVVDLDVPGVEKPSEAKDITKEIADAAGLHIQE